ncbi:TylF/MycF/NovP-related O-methyltransferase [Parvibaculum sp.]|uniref:TylF/MycF/NovP-related O-methyltransferase n=1 Tax=Parvibaculum sp. TaxID=2024848 RepID=UPI0027238F72|nr:TylF/MycF/NovP-related O-methyltransferase [Parvibaculum sp.]MDO9128006.1 TylF/MycF/NovP-related O-methyltransferase [Parvibaculum sp.]MDP1625911.1 TylF/MycF/NovP-related O-methyltransferase [Parvibaculum sp.]MDP2149615.1 TylF/MycF/NovP-related O-methyltransferase [Parvibaculum sp.]MDP3330360.1 TylF/MycF/NovP-related O-methyltransferase [Parvibaculum sp.]
MAKKSFSERLVRRFYYKYFARNILYELQMRARSQSADYAEAHMADAIIFEDATKMLKYCVKNAPKGAVLEFGVADGGSIAEIASVYKGTVHGFDSFEGLPEDWSGHTEAAGTFDRGGTLPKVPKNVELHKGWFSDTIPVWKAAHPDPVGFLHMDCDIYSSTRDVLALMKDRLRPGTIIKFDEYFNYPNWQKHEFRAWKEFVAEHGVEYRYIAFTALHGRVAVEIVKI